MLLSNVGNLGYISHAFYFDVLHVDLYLYEAGRGVCNVSHDAGFRIYACSYVDVCFDFCMRMHISYNADLCMCMHVYTNAHLRMYTA